MPHNNFLQRLVQPAIDWDNRVSKKVDSFVARKIDQYRPGLRHTRAPRTNTNTPAKGPAYGPTPPPHLRGVKRSRQAQFSDLYSNKRGTQSSSRTYAMYRPRVNPRRRAFRRRSTRGRGYRSKRRRVSRPIRRRRRRITRPYRMDDVFRTTYPQSVFAPVTTQTIAEGVTLRNHKATDWWFPNPVYFADALGGHGFYDMNNFYSKAGAGVALTGDNTARQYNFQNNNTDYPFLVRGQHFILRVTPDWQGQGLAEGNITAAKPQYADQTKMVLTAYCFTLRKKQARTDVTSGTIGSAQAPDYAGLTANASGQILAHYSLDPADGTTTITGNGTITGGGWLNQYAKGLQTRIGTETIFNSAAGGLPAGALQQQAVATDIFTPNALSCAGFSYYDSPNLTKAYKIRKIRKVVNAGDSTNLSMRLPAYWCKPRDLQMALPPASTLITQMDYFPKGYSFIVLDGQILSNKAGVTSNPPVAFTCETTFRARMMVPNSKRGGNLYINNPGFLAGGAGLLMKANPLRVPNDNGP